uniref:Uncharacterized protein n=1 Tax=Anguilla anguilla TaxID=7936 RepID=A0A0E9RIH5_ANGAN
MDWHMSVPSVYILLYGTQSC